MTLEKLENNVKIIKEILDEMKTHARIFNDLAIENQGNNEYFVERYQMWTRAYNLLETAFVDNINKEI